MLQNTLASCYLANHFTDFSIMNPSWT